jgi:hypothetical protein
MKQLFLALTTLIAMSANADDVDRKEVLNCNDGELRILLESGEYGRHQVIVRDQSIWDKVVQTYFAAPPCSQNNYESPNSTPICRNSDGQYVVYARGGDGWEIYKNFNWLNSVSAFGEDDRIFELTWFKSGDGVQFEVMSNKRAIIDCGPSGEGPCGSTRYELAPKIVKPNADWFFRNCKVSRPFKSFP